MTDLLQINRNGRRDPAADLGLGRPNEREVLAKQQTARWKKSAEAVGKPDFAGHRVLTVFCSILDFIHQPAWQGACHAASAVFHVLLKEQGVDSVLCHGTVDNNGVLVSHSWVEIEGVIYDAAISNTGLRDLDSPPVFAGKDLGTRDETRLVYGVRTGQKQDAIAAFARNKGFNAYMDAFPLHKLGLWGVARDAGKRMGVRLNLAKCRAAYSNTAWVERATRERSDARPVPPAGEIG